MWQSQGQDGQSPYKGQQPIVSSPSGYSGQQPISPSGDSDNIDGKWWHVGDDKIEDMIRRLNDDLHGFKRGGTNPKKPALRDRSASLGSSRQQSVHFDTGHQYGYREEREEDDSLDQAMRESYEQPEKKRGSWKVSDNALLEFITSAKKVLASESTNATTENGYTSDRSKSNARNVFGAAGGCLVSSQQASCSSARTNITGTYRPPLRKAASEPNLGQHPQSILKPGSMRRNDLSWRPPWMKTTDKPRLIAPVGVGLDGKGNKLVGPSKDFRECPIYLSDARDCHLENVRTRVTGHPQYMQRR